MLLSESNRYSQAAFGVILRSSKEQGTFLKRLTEVWKRPKILLPKFERGNAMKSESDTKPSADCCDGKVVKVEGDRLTTTCGKGDQHHYLVSKDAKVTCDGNESKLSELKQGSTIRMTTGKDDKNQVTAIDCGKHIPALAAR
jgi:hypothetical protein